MQAASRSNLFAWAQLVRLPNVFTSISNVMMGYFFVHLGVSSWETLVLLVGSSSCLYMSGMVLNDWFDRDLDAEARPQRPLPSGRISVRAAARMGWGLLFSGVLLAGLAAWGMGNLLGRPLCVSVALAVAIVLYDGPLKRTLLAPWLMGACRSLNVLLGMSAMEQPAEGFAGFDGSQWAVALGVGMFVTGITWFARREAVGGRGLNLILGMAWMVAGLVALAAFDRFGSFATNEQQLSFAVPVVWPLLVAMLGFSVLRRAFAALASPSPEHIKMAVKHSIFSLIMLDAAVTLAVCPDRLFALAVLSLAIPFVVLTQWFAST